MEPEAALATLTDVSKQVEAAAIFRPDGRLVASTLGEEAATRVAARAAEMLAALDDDSVTQVEAALAEGSVFIVREDDVAVVATTAPTPVIGLVMYDLRSCLRSLVAEKEPA